MGGCALLYLISHPLNRLDSCARQPLDFYTLHHQQRYTPTTHTHSHTPSSLHRHWHNLTGLPARSLTLPASVGCNLPSLRWLPLSNPSTHPSTVIVAHPTSRLFILNLVPNIDVSALSLGLCIHLLYIPLYPSLLSFAKVLHCPLDHSGTASCLR